MTDAMYEPTIDDLAASINQIGDAFRELGAAVGEAAIGFRSYNNWLEEHWDELKTLIQPNEPKPTPWWQRAIWGIVGWPEDE